MTKYLVTSLTIKNLTRFSILFFSLIVFFNNIAFSLQTNPEKFSLYANAGYRNDNLDLSNSGFNRDYRIIKTGTIHSFPLLTKLTWDKISIAQGTIGTYIPLLTIEPSRHHKSVFFLHGQASSGKIFAGKNKGQTIYQAEGINNVDDGYYLLSETENSGKSGNVEDFSVSLNYQIELKHLYFTLNRVDTNWLIPNVGYSIHRQNLTITEGNRILDDREGYEEGPFEEKLNSTYDTNWQGPFVGLTFSNDISQKHYFELSGQYHIIDYSALANSNLETDFEYLEKLEHEAKGSGVVLGFQYSFQPKRHLSYNIKINYSKFTASDGTEKAIFNDNNTREATLDEVNWISTSISLGVACQF